jgi:3-deoxy-D-manno-octulosonate 8-phosphate phosphatase (KDO 8-P phosphatase)
MLASLACCPVDSVPEIKLMSKYISPYKGGEGCVRDVIEKVLKLNDNWDFDIEPAAV